MRAAAAALSLLMLAALAAGAAAEALNVIEVEQTTTGPPVATVDQGVKVKTTGDRTTGYIALKGDATQSLKQRVHVIAPRRTDVSGLDVSMDGTSGGTKRQQYICSGAGCKDAEGTQRGGSGSKGSKGHKGQGY
ncbi:MAG: hypothetical protein J3K34DRAFT_485781 [Monoraphidium minutum]|nr:MAG: hypothetical protein J3K34DRAFT_485781 [Monoraphidium minutum]